MVDWVVEMVDTPLINEGALVQAMRG